MQSLLYLAVAILSLVPTAHGHGYLRVPKSRNWVEQERTFFGCPHCGNGAGAAPGPCGDNFQGGANLNFIGRPFESQTTYERGSVQTFTVHLTANHGGKFWFNLCPRTSNLDQACFDAHPLVR